MSQYFKIDAILADEERVPVVWRQATQRVGYLDPSIATEDVEAGARMELPLWLAETLHYNGLVSIELPQPFGMRSRAELRAGARNIRLRDKSPAFYEVGLKLGNIASGEEVLTLTTDVEQALADRIGYILEQADGGYRGDQSAFKESLTDVELSLYTNALTDKAERLVWTKGGVRPYKPMRPGAAQAASAGAAAAAGGPTGGVAVSSSSSASIIAAASLPPVKLSGKRGRTALSAQGT